MNAARIVPKLVWLAALPAFMACDVLSPPEITAESVSTARITTQGAEVEAKLSVNNPNKSSLTTSDVESAITIGGKPGIARAVVDHPVVVPAAQRAAITLPIRIEWTNPAALAELASAKQAVPYLVTGSVHFAAAKGQRLLTPFQVSGVMTANELALASGGAPSLSLPSSAPSPEGSR